MLLIFKNTWFGTNETGYNLHLLTLFDLRFNTLKLISANQKNKHFGLNGVINTYAFFAEKMIL
jgi:hypothetical protein